MASGNVSPRQKMINMMYLVLTAMLALNVSSEILKAFHKFEMSMERSGANLDGASDKLLLMMESEVEKQGDKAKPFRDKAKEAKQISKEFVDYIEEIKNMFLAKHGGREEEEGGQLKDAKNMEAAAVYFLNPQDQQAKGKELMQKINDTREKLLSLLKDTALHIDEATISGIKTDLRAEDSKEPGGKSWLDETFDQLPLAAAFANLTSYQNNAKKTANDVIALLASRINAKDFKFDALQATIVAPYGSVTAGQPYTAEIFLSAFNSKDQPKVFVNGQAIEVKDGKGMYKAATGQEGVMKYKAEIEVIDPTTGQPKRYAADGEYQVFSPVATISASKMSIFYAGIPNPVDISVPGYRPNQISAVCDNGTLTGSNGQYNVMVQMGQNRVANINVVAKGDDGGSKSFTKQFKIRPLPQLTVTVNGKEGGGVAGAEIQAWNFLNASFGPSFAYDGLNYQVTSYQCIVQGRSGAQMFTGNGPNIGADIKGAAAKCRKGDLIIFFNIKAVGTGSPAGPPKNIDSGPVFRMQ